jgi:hypothetical protein
VRCDRNKPCENCTRRGEVAGCTYATSSVTTSRPSQSDNVQDRIGRLENVVGSLVQELNSPVANRTMMDIPSPLDTTQQPIENSVGRIQVKQNETNYVGSEHWAAIADNVREFIVSLIAMSPIHSRSCQVAKRPILNSHRSFPTFSSGCALVQPSRAC